MAGEKHSALARADAFVGELLSTLDLDNTLVVTSPFLKQALNGNNYMTPLVLYTGANPGFDFRHNTERRGCGQYGYRTYCNILPGRPHTPKEPAGIGNGSGPNVIIHFPK